MIKTQDYFKPVNLDLTEINALIDPAAKIAFSKLIELKILDSIISRWTAVTWNDDFNAWIISGLSMLQSDLGLLEKQKEKYIQLKNNNKSVE